MSAEQREKHADNRRRLFAAGWRESKHAGNRWFPPRVFGGPKRWTIDEYAERFPCSTLDALAVLDADADRIADDSFARGDFLASAVRAMPDRVFAINPWGAR